MMMAIWVNAGILSRVKSERQLTIPDHKIPGERTSSDFHAFISMEHRAAKVVAI